LIAVSINGDQSYMIFFFMRIKRITHFERPPEKTAQMGIILINTDSDIHHFH